jgi:hypothetical protein
MKDIYELFYETYKTFPNELDDLAQTVSSKRVNLRLTKKRLANLSVQFTAHKEAVLALCQENKWTPSRDMMADLNVISVCLADALTLIENPNVKKHCDIPAYVEEIYAASGILSNKYIEHFEDWEIALTEQLVKKDKTYLTQQKNLFHDKPAAQLIGEKLSTSMVYLRNSIYESTPLKDSEAYVRSDLHPVVRKHKKNSKLSYKQSLLKNGDHAHSGNYLNVMQMLGDKFEPSAKKISTSAGNASLYNSLLGYKNHICQQIVAALQNLQILQVGVYNDYPCVMVYIDDNSIIKHPLTPRPSFAAKEAWVDFLISCFVGLVHYETAQAQLPFELERRSSFGFLTPTISPTSESMRISIGLIPQEYAQVLIKSLRKLDELLCSFKRDPQKTLEKIPDGLFYGSDDHNRYLSGSSYRIVPLDNTMQLLWAQVEKGGKTTVQNIVRTPYARQGISMAVFNALIEEETVEDAFNAGLLWSLCNIHLIKDRKNHFQLEFKQTDDISYSTQPLDAEYCEVNDDSFWKVIKQIAENGLALKKPELKETCYALLTCHYTHRIDHLHYQLEYMQEMMFVSAIKSSKLITMEDGYGSNSDEEIIINNVPMASNKIITHNGMRAILSATLATRWYLSEKNILCRVYLAEAYYETKTGITLIATLEKLSIQVVNKKNQATVIIADLNACITNGAASASLAIDNHCIFILDSTSALQPCVSNALTQFSEQSSEVLFLVDSGFKNQQLGSDKNPYGTVRVFAKDNHVKEALYSKLKESDPPLLSATSHQHRRSMKAIGAVPTTRSLTVGFFQNEQETLINMMANTSIFSIGTSTAEASTSSSTGPPIFGRR